VKIKIWKKTTCPPWADLREHNHILYIECKDQKSNDADQYTPPQKPCTYPHATYPQKPCTPFELLFNQNPNYMKLKQFGCLCYPLSRLYNTHKLQTKAVSCVFVGYSLTQNAYLCLDLLSRKIYHSRHVLFDETVFPMAQTNSRPLEKSQLATSALSASHPVAMSLPLLHPVRPPASTDSALGTAAPSSPLVDSLPT
jgi:hypothetical protein